MTISEKQKPFSKKGYLNAEIITRKAYCGQTSGERCECSTCEAERDKLRRQVNRLMGRPFYEGVEDE